MFSRLFILICLLSVAVVNVFSQERTITVLHTADRQPVEDVHVVVRSLENNFKPFKTTSPPNGIVTIPFDDACVVQLSHASFLKTEDTLQRGDSKTILLQPTLVSIDEIIVTASFSPVEEKKSLYP